jgi:hypothetical protein
VFLTQFEMSLYLSYGQSLIDELDLQITDKYREAESHRKTEHYGIILTKQQKKIEIFFSGFKATKLVEKDASKTA